MKKLYLFFFVSFVFNLQSQLVEGIDLSDYPVGIYSSKNKAKIRWKSNMYNSKMKEIKEGYEIGEIGFAGYYVVVLWNQSLEKIKGAMIDVRTGIIHSIPISVKNTSNSCSDISDIFDRYLFLPNSRLFVTSVCKKVKSNKEDKVHQEFFFYLWNEKMKNFRLIKKITKLR